MSSKGGKDGAKDAGKGGKRGSKGGGKGDGKGGKGGLGNRRRFVFKSLCSDPLAANIIGHAGETRKGIEDDSGCQVWISKRDEFFPQSQCRLLLLHADAPSQVLSAIEHTISRLSEVADKDREQNLEVDTPLLGKEVGEYIYRLALPSFIRGKLIGTGGSRIKQLREDTGAKIFVDNEVYDGHQFARVIGRREVISKTLTAINELLQEEVENPEYDPWASVQWFSNSADMGKGAYKESRREGPAGGGRSPPRGKGGHDPGGRDRERRGRSRSRGRRRSPQRPETPERHEPPQGHAPPPERHDPPEGSPVEALANTSSQFPPGALQMDHAVSCDLPKEAVGPLLGEREKYKQHVERSTGTVITVDTSPGPDHLTIMITGPLMWVYVAHCMVMTRYHELEQEKDKSNRGGGGDSNSRVEELQAQLEMLQSQLAEVQQAQRSTGKGGKGGGSRR